MSSTALKLLAALLMLIDHIGGFIPGTPEWFRWLGRLSAPIFAFCVAESMAHTSDRKAYMLRLYVCYMLMNVGNGLVRNMMHNACKGLYILEPVSFNIFGTFFAGCLIIELVEHVRQSKDYRYIWCYLMIQTAPLVLIFISDVIGYYGLANANLSGSIYRSTLLEPAAEIIAMITANPFEVDGGMPFVLLVPVLYFARGDRKKLKLFMAYMCWSAYYILAAVTNTGARILIHTTQGKSEILRIAVEIPLSTLGFQTMPKYNIRFWQVTDYRWLVIFAVIFMLMYNGKKGCGMKYFFYIFYPAHIYFLYIIGCYIAW